MQSNFAAVLLVLIAMQGCTEKSPTTPRQEVTERTFGEIAFVNAQVVAVENPKGAVVITGESRQRSIGWTLDKAVQAETGQRARAQFAAIKISHRISTDTLFVSVEAPCNSSTLTYAGDLSLSVPRQAPCIVTQALYSYVYDLAALVVLRNTLDVAIKRHSGSTQIVLAQGNIAIEAALPTHGFCFANTVKGDILLRIPTTTSANVLAQSGNGNVTFTGLALTNLEQKNSMIMGTLGTGSGEIRLATNIGNVQISGF